MEEPKAPDMQKKKSIAASPLISCRGTKTRGEEGIFTRDRELNREQSSWFGAGEYRRALICCFRFFFLVGCDFPHLKRYQVYIFLYYLFFFPS